MSLKICVLGSGSSGNAIYIASASTHLLIDAGLSARQIALRLERIGVDPAALSGVCLSHEHTDHVAGVRVLRKRFGLPLFVNDGTLHGLPPAVAETPGEINLFQTGAPFTVGDLRIDPFAVPHDAYEPVGFRIEAGGVSVGLVTDLGMSTALVREKLRGCDAVVVEANHDEDLLIEAPRPWALKQRIRGRQGHLSNTAAARLIAECATERLRHVFLVHLSSECNTPDLALRTISSQLRLDGLDHIPLEVTFPDRVSSLWRPDPVFR